MLIPRSLINFVCVCVCVCVGVGMYTNDWDPGGNLAKGRRRQKRRDAFLPGWNLQSLKRKLENVEAEDFMIAQMWDGRVEKEESQSTAGSRYSAKKLKKKKNEEKWLATFLE